MKIEKIEAVAIKIPLTKIFSGSTYRVDSRCTVITRIHAGGLVSEVYNGDDRSHGAELVHLIENVLGPAIIGQDVFAWERVWETLRTKAIERLTNHHLAVAAIACIDTAVWDLFGKALNVSCHKLFGGYHADLPIMAIGGYYIEGRSLESFGEEMAWLRDEAGMAGCKFKVGGLSPEEDAKRVAAARKGAGPDFVIAVDANRGWNAADATRFARLIEPLNIAWFEEPCHWYDDARGMAHVRARTTIPINAGQSEISPEGVRRLLDANAVDIVNFDASEGGGPTAWRRAAAACALVGVKLAHHEEAQIAAHMLGGVPGGTFLECFADPERDPLWREIYNRPPIRNGRSQIPTGPGFGIELNWDLVKRYRMT